MRLLYYKTDINITDIQCIINNAQKQEYKGACKALFQSIHGVDPDSIEKPSHYFSNSISQLPPEI